MARMHPPEFNAADGDNPAERKFFEAVEGSLPLPWEAFHSIDWLERDHAHGVSPHSRHVMPSHRQVDYARADKRLHGRYPGE